MWTTDGGDTNEAWVDGVVSNVASSAIFAGDDTGGIITLTGKRTIAMDGNSLNFLNSGYTLQSDSSTERIIEFRNSTQFLVAAGKTVTIGNKVTVQSAPIGGATGIANGTVIIESGGKISSSGTVSLLGNGTEVQVKTGGLISTAGTVIVGNSTGDHVSLVVDGGDVNVNASSQGNLALINNSGASNASSEATLNSGTITLAGTSSRVLMGAANNATVTSTFNLNGGILTTSGVTDTNDSISTFNFNGGTLKAGTDHGIILAASGNFMDALDNAVVKVGGAKVDSNGNDIKIAAALSHDESIIGGGLDGGFEKLGAGSLTLTGVNTYTGLTKVTAGTLATDATGTFGNGDLNVAASASLTLGNAESIDDAATLTFADTSVVNLSFSGTELVGSVMLAEGSSISAGTYTATQLNSFFGYGSGSEVFFGDGSLNVTSSPIPEPATWSMLAGVGVLFVAFARRGRRARV